MYGSVENSLLIIKFFFVFQSETDKDFKSIENEWYKLIGLLNLNKIFVPDDLGVHTVITIDASDIFEVTSILLKIDSKIILSDWDNRQIPRFR